MDASITPIVVAVITSLGGIIGAYLAVLKGNRETEIKNVQREQRQSDRLDRIDEKISNLEKKVDIHNGYAERFSEIEKTTLLIQNDINYIRKEIYEKSSTKRNKK